MSSERTFLPNGNYKIKSLFSNSLYLTYSSGALSFSNTSTLDNQKWKLEYISSSNGFRFSNVAESNKYLAYNDYGFIYLSSSSNNSLWNPIKIAINSYIICTLSIVNVTDYAWTIYDNNNNITNQPILNLPNFDINNSSQILKLEKL